MRPPIRAPREATAGRGFVAVMLVAFGGLGVGFAPLQPEPQPEHPATPAPPPPSAPQPTPSPKDGAGDAQPGDEPPQTLPDVEILLTDGRRLTGQLVSKNDQKLMVRIAGLLTPLDMSDVAEIKPLKPVEERYAELRTGIDDADEERLLNLARWANSRGRPDLALKDVIHVLGVNPGNQEAAQLRTLLEAQIAVNDHRSREKAEDAPGSSKPERRRFPLLDEAQVNIIRVYEIDLTEPPRMQIGKDSVKRFIETYAGQGTVPFSKDGREAFSRRPAVKILEAMFELQAREFYADVKVMENPSTMKRFRDDVQRWMMTTCATTECHGGTDAGRFQLYNRSTNSDATSYTNFYILDRFRSDEGLPLLDFQNPAQSPLLHFALPREDALFKHPELSRERRNNYRPPFRSQDDDRYKATVEWIRSLYQPRPEYPITYKPIAPFVAPSAKPDNPKPR
ncbi:MAG: hypothetical protein ACOYN0_13780 [Phycisphaerales bacterium]